MGAGEWLNLATFVIGGVLAIVSAIVGWSLTQIISLKLSVVALESRQAELTRDGERQTKAMEKIEAALNRAIAKLEGSTIAGQPVKRRRGEVHE